MALIEFYEGSKENMMACVDVAAGVPMVGDFISIRSEEWRVIGVTWALDHADDWSNRLLRANVVLERAPQRDDD